jgi:hypothetical protein
VPNTLNSAGTSQNPATTRTASAMNTVPAVRMAATVAESHPPDVRPASQTSIQIVGKSGYRVRGGRLRSDHRTGDLCFEQVHPK